MRPCLLCAVLVGALLPAQHPAGPAARVEGEVLDPLGLPVAAATVTAEVAGLPVAATTADGEGRFLFGALPQELVILRVRGHGPCVGGAWLDLAGQQRTFATVPVRPARPLRGRVVDQHGAVPPGAWVVVQAVDHLAFATAGEATAVGPDGRFALGHVPLGPVRLCAWAPDCDAFAVRLDAAADEVLCTVERDAAQEHHFELRGFAPPSAARATLHVAAAHQGAPVLLPPPLCRPAAAAAGRFAVRGWPDEDDLLVRLLVPGEAATPTLHTAYAHRGGSRRRFEPDGPATGLRGRLRALDGTPVGNRRLLLRPLDRAASPLARVVVTTSLDGSFRVPSPVDRGEAFALRALDPDLVIAGGDDRAWYTGEFGYEAHAVPCRRAQTLTGRVLAPDGTPAAGASLAVHVPRATPAQHSREELPTLAAGGPLATGTCDHDGRFAIAGLELRAGETLVVRVQGRDGIAETTVVAADSAVAAVVAVVAVPDLPLQPGAELEGRLGSDANPRAGALLQLHPGLAVATPPRVMATDRTGRYRVRGLWPGYWFAAPLATPQERRPLDLTAGAVSRADWR